MALRRILSCPELESVSYPDWYVLIQAAKYLGVKPWELLEQSMWWRNKALIAMTAESQAQKILDDRNRKSR